MELPIPSDDLSYTPLEKIRFPSYKRYFIEKLYNILNRGYSNRVIATHLVCKETPYWGLERRRMHEVKNGDTVTIGLILNDQECEAPFHMHLKQQLGRIKTPSMIDLINSGVPNLN